MSYTEQIVEEIKYVIGQVDDRELERVAGRLSGVSRIFVTGEGRSGLMSKAFAMRLMHLGLTVYVIGETITPSLQKDDLLVAVSGSGTTKSVIDRVDKANQLGCQVVVFTASRESKLASMCSEIVHIPAATKFRSSGEFETIQPLGSLFDQSLHIVLDTVCLYVAKRNDEGNAEALTRHSNIE